MVFAASGEFCGPANGPGGRNRNPAGVRGNHRGAEERRAENVRVFPVQLLEAALTFCIAALLYAVSVGRLPKKRLSSGAVYPLGLVLYGVMRFFIQFLRAHEIAAEADLIGFLDLWQTVSVVAVLTGAVWLIFLARKRSV